MELSLLQKDMAPQASGGNSLAIQESSRKVAEVKAAMAIAKQWPRNQQASYLNIIEACKRPTLAKQAVYSYPRGDTRVEGPSIRLAEVLAQNWGNMDFGLVELERNDQESTMMAYCWDLQTNVRKTLIFQVPHIRTIKAKGGGYIHKKLEDPRDIYEMAANYGARRMRACILQVIPGDIVEAAVNQCKTTRMSDATPIVDRIRRMCEKFMKLGVDVPMIEKYLGHDLGKMTEEQLDDLFGVFTSIKDGHAKREDYFALKATSDQPDDDDNVTFDDAPKSPKKKATRTKKEKPKDDQWEEKTEVKLPPPSPLQAQFLEVIKGNEDAVMDYCVESGWLKAGTSFANLAEKYIKAVIAQPEAFLDSIK